MNDWLDELCLDCHHPKRSHVPECCECECFLFVPTESPITPNQQLKHTNPDAYLRITSGKKPTTNSAHFLEWLEAGLVGKPYSKLVEYHLRRQTSHELQLAIQGLILELPKTVWPAFEILVDEWNDTVRYSDFWSADSATVLDLITQDARNLLALFSVEENDDILFNAFQIVTLNLASIASDSRKVRKFAGIKKGLLS